MDESTPRTQFVRERIYGRSHGPDLPHARDLLDLERLLAEAPPGMAGSMALRNLTSRYPIEADAIVGELGVRAFAPFEEGGVEGLMEERLRPAGRRPPP